VRNFFWPRDLKQEANLSVRIGRAIQWLSVAAIVVIIVGSTIFAVSFPEEEFRPTGRIVLLPFALGLVVMSWAVGRLSRYIIAGE